MNRTAFFQTLSIVVLMLFVANGVEAAKASIAIRNWQDLRNAIPAQETVVYVAPPTDFYLVCSSHVTKDKTSLTGFTVSLDTYAGWAIQYQFPSYSPAAWDCTESQEFLQKDKTHTVYLLIQKTNRDKDKFQFDWGLYPAQDVSKFGNTESVFDCSHLRTNDWTLVRLGQCYPNQSSIFFNSSPVKIGAIIVTSDYNAVPRIGRYLTPNGDGLNDASDMRLLVNSGQRVGVGITDSTGKVVTSLIEEREQKNMLLDASWSGKIGKDVAPAGYYGVRITINGKAIDYPDTILLEHTPKLKPVNYPEENNFFPMGFFMDGSNCGFIPNDPAASIPWYEKHFSRLKEYGFNNLWIVWWKPGHDKVILETAEKYGIKIAMNHLFRWAGGDPKTPQTLTETYAMPFVVELQQNYGKYPAFMGPIIYDEPTHNVLDRWVTMQRSLYNAAPGLISATVFNDFNCAKKATQSTQLHNITTDIYFIMNGSDIRKVMKGYFDEVKSVVAVAGKRPAWIMPQAFQPKYGNHRMPTIQELRAECWIALAGGAKGIITYLYQSFENGDQEAVIDKYGNPTPLFYELSRISKAIDPYKKLILGLRPAKIGAKLGDDYVHGEYIDKSGNLYIIVATINTVDASIAKIRLPESMKNYKATDLITNTELSNNGTITCALTPGGGTIIKLDKGQL